MERESKRENERERVRERECVLRVDYLRNRERGVVCHRVGMHQYRTHCAGLNSLTGSTTEKPQCSVHHPLLLSFSLFLDPFLLISFHPHPPFYSLLSSPSLSCPPLFIILFPSFSFSLLTFFYCLLSPPSYSYISLSCFLPCPLLSSFGLLSSHLTSSPQFPYLQKKHSQKAVGSGPDRRWYTVRGVDALRAAQMSNRRLKKIPGEANTTYLQSGFESREATSETSAAKPIQLEVERICSSASSSLTESEQQIRAHTPADL